MYRYMRPIPGGVEITTWEAILEALSSLESRPLFPSIAAMAKWAILKSLTHTQTITQEEQIIRFSPHITPAEKSVQAPPEPFNQDDPAGYDSMHARQSDGMLHVLSECIGRCCLPGDLPFNAAETIATIGDFRPTSSPPPGVQLRLVGNIKNLFDRFGGSEEDSSILQECIRLPLWDVYPMKDGELTPWAWTTTRIRLLDDHPRLILTDTFSAYLHKSSLEDAFLLSRLQTLLALLGEETPDRHRAVCPTTIPSYFQ
ncbi:hypothetical protein B0H19DRAFT_1184054 [Mycena capillaripes]|nr:hypothetical protein B0H19DRAFT_1184054 [Mycena capillaripes]